MKKELLIKVAVFGVCLLGIWGCIKLLQLQDKRVYEHAIEKCGNTDNLIEYHTKEGDTFYHCKVEPRR